MMSCSKDAEEREEGRRLASRLLPDEEEHWIERAGARVRWLRLRAQESENAVGTIVLIHGAASNASRWEEFVEKTPLKRTGTSSASICAATRQASAARARRSKPGVGTLKQFSTTQACVKPCSWATASARMW